MMSPGVSFFYGLDPHKSSGKEPDFVKPYLAVLRHKIGPFSVRFATVFGAGEEQHSNERRKNHEWTQTHRNEGARAKVKTAKPKAEGGELHNKERSNEGTRNQYARPHQARSFRNLEKALEAFTSRK
jgi:hypothetical protein